MTCQIFRLRHSWSLILLIVILVAFFFLLPAQVLFSNYKQTMLEEMSQRALAVANTTATLLAMDSLPFIELTRAIMQDPENIDQQYYSKIHTLFSKLRQDANVDYLYTQLTSNDTTVMYLLDSLNQEAPLFSVSSSGTRGTVLSSECNEAFNNATSITTGIIEHERWGTSIFAHSPIIDNTEGKVIGLVSAGFNIMTLESNIQNMFCLIIVLFILIVILVSLALCIVLQLRERSLDVEYLTQLGTKKFFETQLARIAGHAKASKTPFSLLLLDIDGFKLINDTYGHLTGDKVLQAAATIIRSHVRVSDICSRIGGDEFAVILPSSSLEQALLTAQTIQNAMRDHTPHGTPGLELSVSIGVAQWDGSQSIQKLIEQSDQALYKAKKQGKNIVRH